MALTRHILYSATALIMAAQTSLAVTNASGTFSGRVWNDLDRDGIQEEGEPGVSNLILIVSSEPTISGIPGDFFAAFYTGVNGQYSFTFATNQEFWIRFGNISDAFATSPVDIGGDDEIDSDIDGFFIHVTNTDYIATNRDLGIYYLVPDVSLEIHADDAPPGMPLYITNGTEVVYTYVVTNSGETHLSTIFLLDFTYFPLGPDGAASPILFCPADLYPGETATFTTQIVVSASITNTANAIAFPVNALTCQYLDSLQPITVTQSAVVIVVDNPEDIDLDGIPNTWEQEQGLDYMTSNSAAANADGDWMTDIEEFWADTMPTNPLSYLPNSKISLHEVSLETTSTDRTYRLWYSTNILADPQEWIWMPPEKSGTGSAVIFDVTNDSPGKVFRTGVRHSVN